MQFYSEQNSCMFIIPNGLIRNFHAEVWHRNRPIYTQINETNDELQLRIYASLASVSLLIEWCHFETAKNGNKKSPARLWQFGKQLGNVMPKKGLKVINCLQE